GLKVDTSITPGTYTGDVLYTVLPDSACTVYTVRFNANGGTGTMSNQTMTVGTATNLTMNSFTRSGYMFLGWSTDSSAATPTYKDGESVADISGFNTTLDLYAIWGQSTGNMQDFQCTSLASGATTYLTDARDNQVYSVYRIPTDQTYLNSSTIANIAGKCLMTKDLALGYVTGGSITKGQDLILSTGTSAGSTTTSAPIYARAGTNDWSTTNSDTNLQYINGPRSGYEASSSQSYYSYGAAQKVCPRGWRVPTIDEYADNYGSGSTTTAPTIGLAAIVGNNSTGSTILRSYPWNFIRSGYFGESGWFGQSKNDDGNGTYWSSTQLGPTYGYNMMFTKTYIHSSANIAKNNGKSVRCIIADSYTINYDSNNALSGEPSKTTEGTVYENSSITMPTVGTMSRLGYTFLGWSTDSSATTATYTAGSTVTAKTLATATSTTDGGTITLYAVWQYSVEDDGDLGTMQSFVCNNLTSGHTATVTDSRDNQAYTIYRIPTDITYLNSSTVANVAGKCIMTKDLSLGYVTGGSITKGSSLSLTTADSNFDTNASGTGTDGETFTLSGTQTVIFNSSWVNASSSYANMRYANGPRSGYEAYSSHPYYSWGATLVACPKGWRLPTKDEYGDGTSTSDPTIGLTAIVGNNAAGASALLNKPFSFVLGGIRYGPGWTGQGGSVMYWTSTQSRAGVAATLVISTTKAYRSGEAMDNGRPARCIADPVPDCSSTVHPTTTTGCKMKDGNTWIYGNSGSTLTWSTLCTSSNNCKSSTYCPSGYSVPTSSIFSSLVSAQGSGSQLYSVLGLSSNRYFWTSTQGTSATSSAYYLSVTSSSAAVYNNTKTNSYYLLCYKQ
ncbi:InlB B-repeat-containing protein, partial [Candidatus Saccharibacteria bacterium]|nr:InlB B-repeat-containing protein [Candidatus Saccharibacteria bacterium]